MNDHLLTIYKVFHPFFLKKFYWWENCEWSFDPTVKALRIFCQKEGLRGQILRDSGKLSRIDIGIDKFVVSRPGHQDLIIQCIDRYNTSRFG
ncbi:hypothetical protein [Altericista sp. CCNU0014]|uniref:hypothetical protein n=1 Tax=Altericista sp. CCNU0014 TaxID=3082949 RepID=UPI0038502F6A